MFNFALLLFTLVGIASAGNWYVAAYGTIDQESATLNQSAITNFAECVDAGYPILESYPAQCQTDDGQTFIDVSTPSPIEPAPVTLDEAEQLAVMAAVRAHAAKDLGLTDENIDIIAIKEATWPDGCLGLLNTDEMCTMAIVPGYEVTISIAEETATYRTDQTGAVVKKE
jgi:hypothetical protein